MVALAGGKDCLARVGTKSAIVSWEEVLSQGPEVLILMPCGFSMVQTRSELHRLTCRPGWARLPAVRTGEVYVVDGPAYFNRPGPRLVDGLELLAALFHPQRFGQGIPAGAARI
jgi:iron complex transport system substrate-binding protein